MSKDASHSKKEKIEIKMVEQKEMVAEPKEMSVEQTEKTVLGNQLMIENKRSRKAKNRVENEQREQTKAKASKRDLLKEEIRLRREQREQQRLMKEEERLKKEKKKQEMLENKKERIRIREERKLKKLEKEKVKQELQQKKQHLQLSNNDPSHSKENNDKTMDNPKKEENEIKKEPKKKVEQKELTAEEKEERAQKKLLMKEEKRLRMEKRTQQRLIKEEEKLSRQRIKQQKIDKENERIRVREERKWIKIEKEKLKQELRQKKREERENRQKYEEKGKEKKLEKKRIAEEKRRDTALKGMTYLLNMSEKYSSFFREKLLKTNIRGSSKPLLEINRLKPSISDMKEAAADTNTKLSKENDAVNITKQLKYFEGGQLRPYQIEGVQWLNTLFENGINGILADEMGLGKTVQIIALICNLLERKISGPYLIVAPLSTIPNWDMEFKRFAPEVPLVVFHGNEDERKSQYRLIRKKYTVGGFRTYPVVLTTYTAPLIEFELLSGFEWQYIIIDEGHFIKNHQTKLAVNLRKLNSSNRLLLTGTPIHNNITELWALLNFLMPHIFNNVDTFESLLAIEDVQDGNKLVEQEEKNKLLSTIHNVLEPFLLRRLKKDVLGDLVPKKELNIFCPLSKLQRELYSYVLNKNISLLLKRKEEDVDVPLGPRKKRPLIDYRIDESGDDSFDSEPEIEDKSGDDSFDSEPEIEDESGDDSFDSEPEIEDKSKDKSFDPEPEIEDEELLTDQKMEEEPITDQKMEVEPQFIVNITMHSPVVMFKKIVDHPYLVHFPLDPNSATRKLLVNEEIVTSSGKMIVLDQMLKRLKENGHKVLIFSTMVVCLDFIEEMFIMRGYTYCRLDGSNDLEQRVESIESFNKDPNILAFLLSTRAGGLGINLTGADTVIFYDRDWNPQADIQAQDRCHRIGQTKPVMIYSLVTKNTIDEHIIETGYKKRMLEKVVIKDGKFQKKSTEKPDVTKLAKELRELQELLQTESNYFQDPAAAIKEMDKLMNRSELYAEMNMEYKYKPVKNEKDTSFKNMNTNKINTTKLKVNLVKCDLMNESHN